MGKNALMKKKKKKKKASPSTPLNLPHKITRVQVLFLLATALRLPWKLKISDHQTIAFLFKLSLDFFLFTLHLQQLKSSGGAVKTRELFLLL